MFRSSKTMSFWKNSPGPHWSHLWRSLNPFSVKSPTILDKEIGKKKPERNAPLGGTLIVLNEGWAKRIDEFLTENYKTFPKSRICLSEKRISEGFRLDGWIGVGVLEQGKEPQNLVGCVISRKLGRLRVQYEEYPDASLIDFFCVAKEWRKKGVASFLLQEIVRECAQQNRIVHIFTKEGGGFPPCPPLYSSHYIWRQKEVLKKNEARDYIRLIDITKRYAIQHYVYEDIITREDSLANFPQQMSGDSSMYSFCYKGFTMYVCITDTFHRSVPEAWKIGEVCWVYPVGEDVPRAIQSFAVEAVIDHCLYDVVLMDANIPHENKRWKRDASYSLHIYNCDPCIYMKAKCYFVP